MSFYKTWLSIFCIDAVLNVIVYTFLIGKFYRSELSQIGLDRIDRDRPLLEIQLVMYAVIVAIICFFVLKSIRKNNRKELGSMFGGILGLAIFLSHNMFNYAIFKDWSVALVIIDASWGILQGIMIGYLSVFFFDRFNK